MNESLKVVIIGGVAAGTKAACRIMRVRPDAKVTLLDKGEHISYAGCGLPYYVSGVVKEQRDLLATPLGVIRDAAFFKKVKDVNVLTPVEAICIDLAERLVRAKNLATGEEMQLRYDKLLLATGAHPVVPPIPGVDLKNVFCVHTVRDSLGIREALDKGNVKNAVIIGAGLIGVEMAEALTARGCQVTLVEALPQILNLLDCDMASLVEKHLRAKGVKVLTQTRVTNLEGSDSVTSALTDKGTLPADLVIVSVGVRANSDIAREAGLDIGPTGAIRVNEHLQTSDANVYAAGDCVESRDLVSGQPSYVPLGSTANKHGRVAAANISGGTEAFPGILKTGICKMFDFSVGFTGLTESSARRLGMEVVTAISPGGDKAHYMPGSKLLVIKLIVDKATRRLLGVQAVGPGAADKRIDVAAMALTAGMTVDQLANVDLCYAPPYSPALDCIITSANVARNKLDGLMAGISAAEVQELVQKGSDAVLLDVRTPKEFAESRLAKSINIPLGAIRERLAEIDKDKDIIVFCKVSLRGYEAARILVGAGFKSVRVMDGGLVVWPYETISGESV